jgi:glucokinase
MPGLMLAGDVGGTKTELALFEVPRSSTPLREAKYASQNFPDLGAIIRSFLEAEPTVSISAACFGVPGPVIEGCSTTTNLPWTLDERMLARDIPTPRVKLLNDLEAMAWGVMDLPPHEMVILQEGISRPGNMALVAAGTGLGKALMIWDGTRHVVVSSEGGHVDFAPRNESEMGLLASLQRQFGRVSDERVVSGPGLVNIYRYLRTVRNVAEPAWLTERIGRGDPSVAVSEAGLANEDPVCAETVDLFASVYGAVAGNLALTVLAAGGVYLGGGIAPKLRTKLSDGTFVRAFRDKGRLASLLESFPLRLVLNERAPLLGAARVARELFSRQEGAR